MRKVNFEEKTRLINEFRMNNSKKTFTYSEMQKKIKEAGITANSSTFGALLKYFPSTVVDGRNLYEMPTMPIHISQVKDAWKKQKSYMETYNKKKHGNKPVTPTPVADKFSEAKEVNDAIQLLLSKGYKISRPLGLDVKQLLVDHPELAQKYMRYDIIK